MSEAPAHTIVDGVPQENYIPFRALTRSGAARLRETMKETPNALDDRQNLAPSLGCLLDACKKAEGRMVLSGYGIGPQHDDERVTVDALWVADPDLLDLNVTREHDSGCQGRMMWRVVTAPLPRGRPQPATRPSRRTGRHPSPVADYRRRPGGEPILGGAHEGAARPSFPRHRRPGILPGPLS